MIFKFFTQIIQYIYDLNDRKISTDRQILYNIYLTHLYSSLEFIIGTLSSKV